MSSKCVFADAVGPAFDVPSLTSPAHAIESRIWMIRIMSTPKSARAAPLQRLGFATGPRKIVGSSWKQQRFVLNAMSWWSLHGLVHVVTIERKLQMC